MKPLLFVAFLSTAVLARPVVTVNGHGCKLTLEPSRLILAANSPFVSSQQGTLRCKGLHDLHHAVPVTWNTRYDSATGAYVEAFTAGPCHGVDVSDPDKVPLASAVPPCRAGLITCPAFGLKPFQLCP